jgi:hypothetical protein
MGRTICIWDTMKTESDLVQESSPRSMEAIMTECGVMACIRVPENWSRPRPCTKENHDTKGFGGCGYTIYFTAMRNYVFYKNHFFGGIAGPIAVSGLELRTCSFGGGMAGPIGLFCSDVVVLGSREGPIAGVLVACLEGDSTESSTLGFCGGPIGGGPAGPIDGPIDGPTTRRRFFASCWLCSFSLPVADSRFLLLLIISSFSYCSSISMKAGIGCACGRRRWTNAIPSSKDMSALL